MKLISASGVRKVLALVLLAGLVLASLGARPALAQAPVPETPLLQSATQTETATATLESSQTPAAPGEAPLEETATPTETPAASETASPTPAEPTATPDAASSTPADLTATPEAATPAPETPTPSATPPPPLQAAAVTYGGPLLSDGQFVYGPNVGSFNVVDYINSHTPQLASYAETLYGRAEYYSINPKVYLTLLEMAGGLVSNTAATPEQVENLFGLGQSGFTAQLDALSEILFADYYLHLYNYSILPAEQRDLPALTLKDSSTFTMPGAANAGSYAVMAGLAKLFDSAGMASALDDSQPASFVQTYVRLFPGDDPLSQANRIFIPGEVGAQAAPSNLLQLPYPRGESWTFGGAHSNLGNDTDPVNYPMSSLDFSRGWPAWGADTSSMWVVAAAAGVATRISSCNVHILHTDGWETTYYHLDNVQSFGATVNQNDRIAIVANSLSQALCNGGASTGPHVHFSLKKNGAFVAIDGTALSGWVVHSGRYSYDYDHAYFWLERGGVKKYAYVNPLLNDTPNVCDAPTLQTPVDGTVFPMAAASFSWTVVDNCSYSGYNFRIKDANTMDSGGTTIVDTSVSSLTHGETITSAWYYKDLYWGVRAANAAGGANWAVRRFKAVPPPAAPALNLPLDAWVFERSASVSLSWTAAAGATGYYAEFTGGPGVDLNSGWISGTTWTVGVQPGGSYHWQVKARNGSGEGVWGASRALAVHYGTPGSLTAATVSQTQINLAWVKSVDAPANIDGYRIYHNDSLAGTAAPGDTSYPDSGLACGTSYTYLVRAYKGGVLSPESNTITRATYACTPNPPTLLEPVDSATIYSKALSFTWQSPNSPSQNGYTFRISVSPNPETAPYLVDKRLANSVASYSYTFVTDQLYYWHMRTWNVDNFASAWVSRPFTVHGTPPGATVLRKPAKNTLITGYTPTLDWDDATDAEHYQVQIATSSSFSTARLVFDVNSTPSTWDVPPSAPLPSNDTYYWRVRAVNEHGINGAWTATSYFRTALTTPVLLDPPEAGNALTTRPTFLWGDVKWATSYVFQLSASLTFSPLLINAGVTAASYTPGADLARNQVFYWRVYAKGTNPSPWSVPFSFTSADPLPIPTLVSPASGSLISGYTPLLNWNDVPGVDHYRVQVATSSRFSLTRIVQDATAQDSEFLVPADLLPNTTFYWRVSTYDGRGQYSRWSAVRSFRTPMLPPVLLDPADQGQALTTRPTFAWGPVSGATAYVFQLSAGPAFSPLLINTGVTASSYTPTSDLARNQPFYWRVYAKGTNPSAWSLPFSFNSADPPPIPTLISPVSGSLISGYTPTLDWNDMPGADYYQVQVSTSSSFATAYLVYNQTPKPSEFGIPAALAANKKFFWRVRSYALNGQYSLWSPYRYFRTAMLPPVLLTPALGAALTTLRPTFDWVGVSGATSYVIQVSTVPDFSTRLVNAAATHSIYKPSINLPRGVPLYWRVYAKGTNPSAWSVGNFSIP
jgi:LasA protease